MILQTCMFTALSGKTSINVCGNEDSTTSVAYPSGAVDYIFWLRVLQHPSCENGIKLRGLLLKGPSIYDFPSHQDHATCEPNNIRHAPGAHGQEKNGVSQNEPAREEGGDRYEKSRRGDHHKPYVAAEQGSEDRLNFRVRENRKDHERDSAKP